MSSAILVAHTKDCVDYVISLFQRGWKVFDEWYIECLQLRG